MKEPYFQAEYAKEKKSQFSPLSFVLCENLEAYLTSFFLEIE